IRAAMISVALGVSFASFGVGEAVAGAFEDGMAAYNRRDYATAFRNFLPLAQAGDANAQDGLGLMYEKGQGVTQNYKKAVKWYRLAAKKGNFQAQYDLGLMYENGYGVGQDDVRAFMWINLAAGDYPERVKKRDDLAAKLTPAQLVQAKAMAVKCKASHYKKCGE
ncbi:MAG: tetratricopeptide repeat protein, partial [Alphaproteobacteria bacterium]|nr:tetratricopeptide repeat protein [Alphaproteobacteria bacterium]